MPTANEPLTASGTPSATEPAPVIPCGTDSPAWQLTQDNWVDENVERNWYAWWHGTSNTVLSRIPPAPVTSNDAGKSAFGLAQQLVSKAAGVQTFQCRIGSNLNCIASRRLLQVCKALHFNRYIHFWPQIYQRSCHVGHTSHGSRCLN